MELVRWPIDERHVEGLAGPRAAGLTGRNERADEVLRKLKRLVPELTSSIKSSSRKA